MIACACGCPLPVPPGKRGHQRRHATPACRARAARARRAVRAASNVETTVAGPLKPKAQKVLRTLRAVGQEGATTFELCQPDVGGVRFGARVHELREAGYVIRNTRLRNGADRYWLTREPGQLMEVGPARAFKGTPSSRQAVAA